MGTREAGDNTVADAMFFLSGRYYSISTLEGQPQIPNCTSSYRMRM